MTEYCEVAVPVPLDQLFTYKLDRGISTEAGARVVVPFRERRLIGIVTELHDRAPAFAAKNVLEALDESGTPALTEELVRLGRWIGVYYLAPIGEVFRTMLPLTAELRREVLSSITDEGHNALHSAGCSGSSARSRRTPEDQDAEYRVLNYLAGRDNALEPTLRSATRASRDILAGMLRKKWVARLDVSHRTNAVRTRQVAQLKTAEGKLNTNQRLLVEALASAGGRLVVDDLRELDVPRTTLSTLVKRAIIEILQESIDFARPALPGRGLRADLDFNSQQRSALEKIRTAVDARAYAGILLHGVTGSGKTAVYLAAMKSVLDAGRSAIMLVPEIGLTPAVAADVHHVFGNAVAILHSGLSDKERAEHWHRIRHGEARAVVGTRSAVFAPVSKLALIIVDEEQDSSYKQEETPRYHARDVA